MRFNRIGTAAVGLGLATALVLTGCAAEDDTASTSAEGIITTNGSEPQNPLVTTNTTEVGGGKILTSIYAGLVSYDAAGEISNEVAESLETDDSITWTVTLKDGWTFTNGEAVTASSFVNAWNYGALITNAQSSSYFFDNIVGYTDVNAMIDDPAGTLDEDGSVLQVPAPTAETMSGLTVVDDQTFTVELVAAEADWPLRLGYTAYMPLPEVAFEDMEAFGENPIGNGPYMLDGEGAWEHDIDIDLVANPDYAGERVPANEGVTMRFYATLDAAYADMQGGNLDVLDAVPDSAFETYETEFDGRTANQPAAVFQAINIPQYLEHWTGEEGELRRAAISRAINRDEITEFIFQGTRTPATDFTSPVIDGYSDELEGAEVLEYDADIAADLWAQADAIAPYGDTVFDIAYNSDGGHQAWVDAATQSISNALGITAQGKPYPTFADALTDRAAGTLTGATRAGWQADYPSLYNFLAPNYQTGAGSNYEGYSSEEFDNLLDEGSVAPDVETATGFYQDAQEVLLKDLPTIPLWYANVNGVWGDQVDNVVFGWDSVPLYDEITKG
ncbi:oligopeptide transport system substrate-binding protein [Glaciihabitans tibetensis]|uniref:Oligopeptide transport system substrate-binding protein n=1 Tax=Glaciihabitans tibetensis TaxID=1266600 RepID=A0A2T0VGT1_9MICO|nr:ABC transporter substrate-binding protein [Glaciihabitans tibetensis]PRY69409.1 oligopeptide transport system substrate-binding protein [Glaciihabitans tibetensis]